VIELYSFPIYAYELLARAADPGLTNGRRQTLNVLRAGKQRLRFLPAGNILDCRQPPLQLVAASRQEAEKLSHMR
jgi:hypothetical protein